VTRVHDVLVHKERLVSIMCVFLRKLLQKFFHLA